MTFKEYLELNKKLFWLGVQIVLSVSLTIGLIALLLWVTIEVGFKNAPVIAVTFKLLELSCVICMIKHVEICLKERKQINKLLSDD